MGQELFQKKIDGAETFSEKKNNSRGRDFSEKQLMGRGFFWTEKKNTLPGTHSDEFLPSLSMINRFEKNYPWMTFLDLF